MEMDELIRVHGRRVFGLCLSLCKDRYEAEELYQDTWLRVLKNISKYDEGRDFEPWAARICVNIYRNRLRRLARSPFLSFRSEEERDSVLESAAAPERPDYSYVREAVDKLPEKYRLAVLLFYFEGMDIAAAAKVMGIPDGTVKSRLSRARELLKEELKDEDAI